jgi:hypothetical protein
MSSINLFRGHDTPAFTIHFIFSGFALNSLRKYLEDVQRNNGVEVKTGLDQVYIMENDAFKFIYEVHQKVEFTSVCVSLFFIIKICSKILRMILNTWKIVGPCPNQCRCAFFNTF